MCLDITDGVRIATSAQRWTQTARVCHQLQQSIYTALGSWTVLRSGEKKIFQAFSRSAAKLGAGVGGVGKRASSDDVKVPCRVRNPCSLKRYCSEATQSSVVFVPTNVGRLSDGVFDAPTVGCTRTARRISSGRPAASAGFMEAARRPYVIQHEPLSYLSRA